MILLFSTHEDQSTQLVIDWLHYYHYQPIVVNELNPITDIYVEMSGNAQETIYCTLQSGQRFGIDDINIVWYRRGLNFLKFPYSALRNNKKHLLIYEHLKAEYNALSQYLFNCLQHKTIGEYNQSLPNKLLVLKMARKAGLNIPHTRIITSKKQAFPPSHINKNITEIVSVTYKGNILYNRTTEQKGYPDSPFFPSLIQQNIEKYCELRIFFFVDTFFAMATLPQSGNQLKTDTRDITAMEYLHRMPFELPKLVKKKLLQLITQLDYTTCSVDMLIDKEGKYYFLELNPVGQFGNLSHLCHLHIEQYIAKKLIGYEKESIFKRNTSPRSVNAINLLQS